MTDHPFKANGLFLHGKKIGLSVYWIHLIWNILIDILKQRQEVLVEFEIERVRDRRETLKSGESVCSTGLL